MEINREIKNITSAFVLEDNLTECVPYGSGHINDTYRLTYGTGKHSESCDDKGWTSLLCR